MEYKIQQQQQHNNTTMNSLVWFFLKKSMSQRSVWTAVLKRCPSGGREESRQTSLWQSVPQGRVCYAKGSVLVQCWPNLRGSGRGLSKKEAPRFNFLVLGNLVNYRLTSQLIFFFKKALKSPNSPL